MVRRRGLLWRFIHSSADVKIALYFLLFFLQMLAYTVLFYQLYPVLEKKPISWQTSLLFVVETITTTGYGELLPFQNQYTVILAIIMMLTGIALIFMIVPLLIAPYLSDLLRSTPPQRTPHELRNHIVIIGYGELTHALVESLMIGDYDIVIVEQDEKAAEESARLYRRSVYTVWGNYNDPSTWSSVWMQNSGTVILCVDERTAATIILGIREMTSAKIIAVVDKLSYDRYLREAGAEYVLSPKHTTGRILARHTDLAIHHVSGPDPAVFGQALVDSPDNYGAVLRIIHLPVLPGTRPAGRSLKEIGLFETHGFYPFFMDKSGKFFFLPKEEEIVDPSSGLFLIGPANRIREIVEKEFLPAHDGTHAAVIAGFGDVGQAVYYDLTGRGIPCRVIDQKRQPVEGATGNAEDEHVLKEARITDASYCIVALNRDDVNIFTTLMARGLNPTLRILARANEPASVDKLYRAGADYVALLPRIGGQLIARVVLSDRIHVILDLPDNHKVIRKHLARHAVTVQWIEENTGARILGIEGQGRAVTRPGPAEQVQEGDTMVALGDLNQLKKFIRLC